MTALTAIFGPFLGAVSTFDLVSDNLCKSFVAKFCAPFEERAP
jgi:hypothetical protein